MRSDAPDLVIDGRIRVGDFTVELSVELEGPVVLVGPNGSGKSTLLRALAGGLAFDGRIEARGEVWVHSATGRFLPPEARNVGFLPQTHGLFPHLDAAANVAFGLAPPQSDVAMELLTRVGLAELARRRPRTLSGGERQRVALARALARSPTALLLDEPLAAMDVRVRREMRGLLADELTKERVSVVATHDVRDLVAWQPTVVCLENGRLARSGTLDALESTDHPFLEELLEPIHG